MIRVLVAGASGLIGGRLLEHLGARADVRLTAASRQRRDWPNGVDGCVLDLASHHSVAAAVAGADVVINLASMSEAACEADPRGALDANADGPRILAEAANAAGVRRFVQLSTIKVYGPNLAGRIDEDRPTQPRSHYAITHRAAEDYVQRSIAESVVLRLSNGFGAPAPGSDAGWDVIVNEFCKQAVTDHVISIRSSGRDWRSFVPLDDVAAALMLAIHVRPGIYNLGAELPMTIRDAAERVAAVAGPALGFVPDVRIGPAGPAPSSSLDFRIDKLMAAGFRSRDSFDSEVRRVIDAAVARFRLNPA